MKNYWLRFGPIYLVTALIFILILSLGNKTVTVLAENSPLERGRTIIIDAGHGGEDGGATSCSGRLESHINLEIALRLDALCHLLGYETRMIRTTDTSVYTEGNTIAARKASDLRQRVRIANKTEKGILISIHQNTFSDSRYSGAQVFYAKTDGSKELANALQQNFALMTPNNHRQAKEASGVYLMEHMQNTAVLIECGFLSNYEEEVKLQNPRYQKELCCSIISAVSKYINP